MKGTPVSAVLDLLFPPKCAFCGSLVEKGDLCEACKNALPFREEENAAQLIGENNYLCAVALYYDGPAEAGVKALKFGRKSWRAKIFARYVAQAAAEQLSGEFDAVTYVPVSLRRNFERGFDQARLLAEETARHWNIKAEPTLRKIRHTKAQSSLKDSSQRKRNVKGAYIVPHPDQVRDRRFLLIDDVCTTGSTMSAAADALMEAGAAGVVCAALAGGHKKMEESPEPLE